MRLRTLEEGMRVFMNPYDYQTMLDCADNRRVLIAMRIMGEMGLRVGKTTANSFRMGNVRESTHPDVDILFMPIYGKDSLPRDTEGKYRTAWLPRDLYERIQKYQKNEGIDDDQPLFGVQKRQIQRDIEDTRENAAIMEEDERFEYITAHDFRAYFATNMALRQGVDINIVMTLGGWEDRQTMDPYLDANFDDIIQEQLAVAGVLSEEIDAEPSQYEKLRNEIQRLRQAIENLDVTVPDRDEDQQGLGDFS